jgi:hypothetical protein
MVMDDAEGEQEAIVDHGHAWWHMHVLQMTSNHLALVLAAASPASTQLPHTWTPQVASGCSGTNRYTAEPAEGTGPLYDFFAISP